MMQHIDGDGKDKSTRGACRPRKKLPRFRFPSNCIHILIPFIILLLIISPAVSEQSDVVEEPIDSVEITANVAPILTGNITVGQISTSGAQISWMTNVPSDSWVYYDTVSHPNAEDYAWRVKNDFSTLSHLLVLSGLRPGTLYHFRIVSHGSGGVSVTSADRVFRTISIPPTGGGGGGGGGGSYGSFFSVIPFTSPTTAIPTQVETPLPTLPPYGPGSGNATYGNWSARINVTPTITPDGVQPEEDLLSFVFQKLCLIILIILVILAILLIYLYHRRRRED